MEGKDEYLEHIHSAKVSSPHKELGVGSGLLRWAAGLQTQGLAAGQDARPSLGQRRPLQVERSRPPIPLLSCLGFLFFSPTRSSACLFLRSKEKATRGDSPRCYPCPIPAPCLSTLMTGPGGSDPAFCRVSKAVSDVWFGKYTQANWELPLPFQVPT